MRCDRGQFLAEGVAGAYKFTQSATQIALQDRGESVECGERWRDMPLRKAVFLDRDGVINRENGFIHKPEQFELLPGVGEAIASLNAAGYLCVVVTNQPVIARGECDEAGLAIIHSKMGALLACSNAHIDEIYYCPHHPEACGSGERAHLKIKCGCRKPETGLITAAQKELHIDLQSSWLVGDATRDILAANRAGLKAILVLTGKGGKDGKYECKPDFVVKDLPEAANLILKGGGSL